MENVWKTLSENLIIVSAFWAWFIAQVLKFIIEIIKNRKFDFALLVSTGGMPSSHSSSVMATTTAIAVIDGLDSSMFALSLVISLVVMYDAAGVRRAAGSQAAIINLLLDRIEDHGIELDKKLKELLGHTPIEVLGGALLGIVVGILATT